MRTKKMGDPLAEDTDIGPQARTDLRDDLHKQVVESVVKGAKLLLGGEVPPGNGSYYPPTVLTDVRRECLRMMRSSSGRSLRLSKRAMRQMP